LKIFLFLLAVLFGVWLWRRNRLNALQEKQQDKSHTAASQVNAKVEPRQNRKHGFVIPLPMNACSAVKLVAKNKARDEGQGEQNKAQKHEAEHQALEREQGQAALVFVAFANFNLGVGHERCVNHSGCKHAIRRNAQSPVQG